MRRLPVHQFSLFHESSVQGRVQVHTMNVLGKAVPSRNIFCSTHSSHTLILVQINWMFDHVNALVRIVVILKCVRPY